MNFTTPVDKQITTTFTFSLYLDDFFEPFGQGKS